ENFIKTWFVLKDPFYSIVIVDRPALHFLATAEGKTLYTSTLDTAGSGATAPVSACTSATCMANWPAYHASATPVVPTGVLASDFGSFTRPDGTQQSTYKGHPLYFFAADSAPTDAKGNGKGPSNSFFVVDPTK